MNFSVTSDSAVCTSIPMERANAVMPDGPGSSLIPSTDKSPRTHPISAMQ